MTSERRHELLLLFAILRAAFPATGSNKLLVQAVDHLDVFDEFITALERAEREALLRKAS